MSIFEGIWQYLKSQPLLTIVIVLVIAILLGMAMFRGEVNALYDFLIRLAELAAEGGAQP